MAKTVPLFLTGPIVSRPIGFWERYFAALNDAVDDPPIDWSQYEGVDLRALMLEMGEPD